jgi:ribonuclease G
MSGSLLVSCAPGEVWAALLDENEELVGLRVLRAGMAAQEGDLFLGRVVALKPELPAALVDIGLDRPGFLSAEDVLSRGDISGLHEGQAILVQVKKEARADKAVGLTMRPRLAGRFVDFTPTQPGIRAEKGLEGGERERLATMVDALAEPGEGFVLRQAAAAAIPGGVAKEIDAMRARWAEIERLRAQTQAPQRLEESEPPAALALAAFVPAAPSAIVIDDRAALGEARRWLKQHRPDLVDRLALHREAMPLFEHYGIADDIAAALAPRVALPGGGALVIETTAAATFVDVDSGSGGGSGRIAEDAILAVNLAAARALARQIRLRALAGPIIVDFVGMRARGARERVRAALAAALASDRDSEILGWTRLGHLELVRKRRHPSLSELLYERAPGGGWVKQPATVALEALAAMARAAAATPPRAALLRLHPEVATLLDGALAAARAELEARLGRALQVIAEPGRARDSFDFRLE